MPFATAAAGNSPASIVSITGDSQSASTDSTAGSTASSRSSANAAYFEKSKLTGVTMLHIKGLREGYVLLFISILRTCFTNVYVMYSVVLTVLQVH
jgi:hypothetical protein